MPSPSVSVPAAVSATSSTGTSVAGSSTGAGSGTDSDAGSGSGTTSTGGSTESTEGGAITVVSDPGAISPQVIVQLPAAAPEVTQLLSILPMMNGPSVFWAEATPLPARSPTLRLTRMLTHFIATPLVAGCMVRASARGYTDSGLRLPLSCNGWISNRVSLDPRVFSIGVHCAPGNASSTLLGLCYRQRRDARPHCLTGNAATGIPVTAFSPLPQPPARLRFPRPRCPAVQVARSLGEGGR